MISNRLVNILLFLVLIGWLAAPNSLAAQASTEVIRTSGTERHAAGPKYEAAGFKKLLLGTHYRPEWTTPIDVPVLDMEKSAGGLIPWIRSGGQQSKSLFFKSEEGSRFIFRSIDKDPSKILPPELRETVVADAVRDGISTAHPYGAFVVPPLAEAAGIFHTNPKLVVFSDDERLEEHREEFAGVVGIMEEFVIGGPNETPGFAGLKKIVDTEELFEILEASFVDFVDQRAYLKARLLDLFISDWDRHVDQWRWGRVEKDGRNLWYPIPLDRDQALVSFDGLLTSIAENRHIVPQFEGLEKKSPDVWSLTFQGRHTDRLFLNSLTEQDFEEVAQEFVQQVTDEVVESAVRRLPEPIYGISGRQLSEKLKDRRQLMSGIARKFYQNLAKSAEIVGRDNAEYAEISSVGGGNIELKLFERDTGTGPKKGAPLFQRSFKADETKEIRLYLMGGDDKAVLAGGSPSGILLRIIGGPGSDEIVNQSPTRALFYDVKSNTKLDGEGRTAFKAGLVDTVVNAHRYSPLVRSRGNLVVPVPFMLVNSEDGLFVGAGVRIFNYGFRKAPYANSLYFRGKYATRTSTVRIAFTGDFVDALFGLGFLLDVEIDPIETTNFYGLGNDSRREAGLEDDDFYFVPSSGFKIQPMLYSDLSKNASILFGGAVRRFETDLDEEDSRFVLAMKPYGVEVANLLELNARLSIDTRDVLTAASKGVFLAAHVSHFPQAFDNDSTFTKVIAEGRTYLSPTRSLTLALRARAEKIWGTPPFYQAAYLGGPKLLRGFRERRFGGDASAFGGSELRFKLFRPTIAVPTDVGLFGFGEAGRVWLDGDSPGDWSTTVGGGLWLAPIYRNLTISLGIADSTEGVRFFIFGGFGF